MTAIFRSRRCALKASVCCYRYIEGASGLKSEERLREILVAGGMPSHDDGREITIYCQSGVRAAYSAWVLSLLGFQRVRVYEGSMMEWSASESTPIVKGKQ